MGDFIVLWDIYGREIKTKRFINVPEDFVDGFIHGLEEFYGNYNGNGSIIKYKV